MNEVADDLGVHYATVRRWVKKLGIETMPDQFDSRVRLVSYADQERLRMAILRTVRMPKEQEDA